MIWQVDPTLVSTLNAAQIFSPPLCPISFKTRVVKVEFKAAGPLSYVEIDAVLLTGTANPPLLNLVETSRSAVVYSPGSYAHGNDSFVYRLNRCINFSRFRTGYSRTAIVNVTIPKENHAPIFQTSSVVFDISNTSLTFASVATRSFQVSAMDLDSDPLTFSCTCPRVLPVAATS